MGDGCKCVRRYFKLCGGGRRRGVGAAGLGGFSRGLGQLGCGCGFEPWLGGLAWLSCGSHPIRRKAEKSSRLDWLHVCLPRYSQLASHCYPTRQRLRMTEEDPVDISEEVNPPVPTHSQPPSTHAPSPPTPAGVPPAYSDVPSMHLPPPNIFRGTPSTSPTGVIHEGTVNQLAASVTTNMAELFALLRGPNRASSSSTPPLGQGPTVDPTSWIPPTQVPENTDAPALPTTHTSTVLSAPPPVSMPALAVVYTIPPPMVFPASSVPTPAHLQAAELPPYPSLQPHISLPYQAPPPINTTFLEPGTPTHTAQFASPTHFLPEVDAEQERRFKRMEETIRALQANETRPNASYGDCSLFPGMRLPLKVKIPEFKTYEGTTDPRHHLRHYRGKILQYWDYEEFVIHSFQDNLTGSPLDWFMSQKAEDIPTWADLSRKFIDQYQPPVSRVPPPAQKSPTSQGPQVGTTQYRSRKQYTPLPAPLSHIYRQLLAGNQIQPISPGPNFDSTTQDQSKHCEYHQGAPGHTLDNCWRLRGEIQRRIDNNRLTFNACHGNDTFGTVYENPVIIDKGKAPTAEVGAVPESTPFPSKRVTEEEAEAFMKIIKVSEYKVVEQMAKSPAHISLLALLLKALLRILTAAQVPKETPPDRIEETVSFIFSNTISFSDDELPFEGWTHSRALHIVYKCNNYIIGRVMIDNGSALNVCPVTTLKQMNVDLNRVRPSKTAVRAFDGSRREKLITVKGEEDYAIYKETVVPYISVGDDENLPFHSFETISVIRDYGEIGPSRADRIIGKVLLRHNYIPGAGLGAREQGINRPIDVDEYKNRRGLGFRPSCHEIIEARRGNHLHRLAARYGKLNRGISIPPLSHFFPGPPHIIGSTLDGTSSDSDDTPASLSAVYAVTEEIPSGVHILLA
ncbi:hypothetical protein CRG98_008807 [Punica granatum]|uniref:G-patch domain-containing protein n=1 Tax=Punica granatum TaxID=22663 RepID=A0A2I0KQR0_PUNGR|nr:hypothetical protein CRG98_008807 [Punica granatum]